MSWRIVSVLVVASVCGVSPSVLAQDKPEKKKDEGDVVFDNRGLAKKQKIEKQQKDEGKYENDTPFANTAPNVPALREQRWQPGIGGGYRVGWAFPGGGAQQGASFGDVVKGMVFLWGDIGYWVIPQLFVGADLSAGYVLPKCDGNSSCWGFDLRGGPEVLARFLPFRDVSPMAGLGFGYEYMQVKASNEVASATDKLRGFELLNLQAGVDVRSQGAFYGLFLFYSFATFDHESFSVEDKTGGPLSVSRSGSIDQTRSHHWLGIGARGTLE